ncbi:MULTISPECIES: hypothetical protein [unclassified Paraburkholderia]|uniref:hypothetical protein n=1 Tax=unclassified Paraburkholderia TaxID=2615204 RepID=UPI00160B803E|nr:MULTISPECIES: hypothetical protein [unclassified Paraburkholderia]MBB5445188.1 hypothetical protein [Paraburkholderia sp. WSM4177]MBB5485736.1 hypothetical protein [Paraburkholderia sp. WSM4180]
MLNHLKHTNPERPDRGLGRWGSIGPGSERAALIARYVVPILFGLYALLLGQDNNWDMRNYHLYNGFAFLHDKLAIDLAPGGMQTYFTPTLDVLTWLLYAWLPAPLVGFALGVLHGLAFVIVFDIARCVLDGETPRRNERTSLWIALAGGLTANYLSGIGNSMGDNTTALLVLLAVSLTLKHWDMLAQASLRAVALALTIGALTGVASGLKLTNTIYAIALCAGCLVHPGNAITRLRIGFAVGMGVIVGLAASGGYWFATMWRIFRNPFFPQFSNLFPNPLVPPIGVADLRWFPRSVLDALLWPFIFSLHSQRISDTPIRQVIWALLYAAAILWVARAVWRALDARRATSLTSRQAFVLVFIAVGYVMWLKTFSVYRYVVAMEVLAPLALYVLVDDMLPGRAGKRIATWVIAFATLVVVAHGAPTYGHVRWARKGFHADTPAISDPRRTTGVLPGGAQGLSWLVTQFPPDVAFVTLDPNVLVTSRYNERLKDIIAQRGGPAYVVLGDVENSRLETVRKAQALADETGFLRSEWGCTLARRVVDGLRLPLALKPGEADRCRFALRAGDEEDLQAENAAQAKKTAASLEAHGLRMTSTACGTYHGWIGNHSIVYQWCPIELLR